ncbi:MAG: putative DNA binding domain-containing protein [Euryarchaeota archaeon]|nr:putative DNA binding domain-containing protein [Euryarchaeota archaeon]
MSLESSESRVRNISETKLCEYLGRDELIEKVTFEVKRATGKGGTGHVPSDFYPTYSAMANTLGGTVVFGLEEIRTKEGEIRFKVIGIKNPEKVIDQLFSTLNNRSKVSLNLIANDHISIIPVQDTNIIKITIPKAGREQKPVYLNQNPINHTYIRNGSGDHLAREEDVRLMIREASTQTTDAEILEHYTIDDLNIQSVLAYRNLFRITSPSHSWNELNDEDFLRRIKALNKDRSKNISGITKAGLLMFGNEQSITDHFPYYHLDYLEKYSDNPEIRYDNKISSGQGTWSGNIFDFFREVDRKLLQNLDIPFRLKGRQRIDEPAHSEVLREALVNALIHADYSGSAPVKIENYPEKFVFTNPGDMRRPLALAKEGGISDCRNRIIQNMFSHIGSGDQEGFGIVKIFTKWEQNTGNNPIYKQSSNPVMTTLTLNRNPDILKGEADSLEVKPDTLRSEADSLEVKPDTLRSEASVTKHEALTERDLLLSSLSEETKEALLKIGKRTRPEIMKDLIRKICSQADFTIDELCIILEKKSRSTFYYKYISELLKEKKLRKTNPEKPTSPKQKYRTVLSQKEETR